MRRTDCKKQNFRIDSSESYALNCQFVLGLIQTGCGAQEAAINLTFLDLPHASSFQKTSFPRIQSAIRPAIKEVTGKCMMEAREKEVSATIGENKMEDWRNKKIDPKDVKLTISYDMGWNKRSSGHKYDSISGQGFVLGGQTKKILQHRVMSKHCSKCRIAANNQLIAVPHECPKNHIGSSKSMECEAIFRMVVDAFNNLGYTIAVIVSDDDSTMKSNLRHSFEEKIKAGLISIDEWPRTKKNIKSR